MINRSGFTPVIALLIIAIAVVVVGGGAAMYVVLQRVPVQQPATQSTSTQPQVGGTVSSTVDTSTWKTYRNEKYRFEFKYPSDFRIYWMGLA